MSKNKKTPNAEQLRSALMQALKVMMSLNDEDMENQVAIDSDSMHFHDGSQAPIAWNDVQAILYWNEYSKGNEGALLPVPDTASEGYNQHHHTSEFDGGLIPGVLGVHDHRDNQNGGLAFACFHPATSLPQAAWER